MTEAENKNIALVGEYLRALSSGQAGEALRRFFTEDARQLELPNQLNPRGQDSDLAQMLLRSEQGSKILQKQEYEIISAIASGECVAVEARWTGVLAIEFGALAPGSEMTASFAIFLRFRAGRIALQRNYDCFDPW